ncbi:MULTISPECIES: ribonuclease P protein component [Asticcacaulis]|uniref:ribonuclease P protein component n=1 Tax=Asticcacaulis TaxID=76890 RepID=UPI001AE7D681|nr:MULTISPECIES: ribonuclease P protein component [Asticcacaulis]MBP2157499.1 ribonuclease P protein component [Asticcacaulis solisilvae]MDR6798544.1 ribonuclease P protein component [Asticcacaulis sp. BE141]
MIPRLKVRADFLAAAKAPYQARGAVVVQARRRQDSEEVRVGFTATKKIGNAVTRNRAKRRLREAAEALLPLHALPGHDYVFIARAGTVDRDWQGLLDDVKAALIRLARPKPHSKSDEDLARPTGRPS